ncbi:ComF family protein [Enorma burkinafasonensis]|uniref:ComF family protein n=1 Tax=Enorma burkinafasonensis TaxID=2590867 RepID=UPI00119D5DC1|nr:phosphoribosyltransferase family protein [Enorma burkinafasonensis]
MDAPRARDCRARWADRARRAGAVALEAMAPTRCAGCERPGALICPRCLTELVPIDPVHACTRCGAPFGDLLCTECGHGGDPSGGTGSAEGDIAPAPDRCLAAAVFEGPLPRIIHAYKDAGERRLAPLLAELMADAALHAEEAAPGRFGGIVRGADAVTFVPATAAAFARRGFDHMEEIARSFSRLTGVPYLDALAKRGASDQRVLGREERARSARGAYVPVADVAGMRLLLLDDVVTTGSTVRAAASSLASAGAAHIDALALARVW